LLLDSFAVFQKVLIHILTIYVFSYPCKSGSTQHSRYILVILRRIALSIFKYETFSSKNTYGFLV
jgi:hypothetical protein